MGTYFDIIVQSYKGYFNYLVGEVTRPSFHSYFYGVLVISLFYFWIEQKYPWREDQPRIRQDFWLDGFYMFFNFFIFSLILYDAVSTVSVRLFQDFLSLFGITFRAVIPFEGWPWWSQLLLMLVVRDFIQFNLHRLLHRSSFLWEFHKVHHSVKQMGFAAQMRYHWMENIFYRTLEYIPLGLLGFSVTDFFIVHMVAFFIGHFNHSNFKLPLGPLKYLFNNPQMHIWHHAKKLPNEYRYGCNFGLGLSCWDYIFKTDYIPYDGRDIELGFPRDKRFPKTFIGQALYPWKKPPKATKKSLPA